jgi:hypothetical protein
MSRRRFDTDDTKSKTVQHQDNTNRSYARLASLGRPPCCNPPIPAPLFTTLSWRSSTLLTAHLEGPACRAPYCPNCRSTDRATGMPSHAAQASIRRLAVQHVLAPASSAGFFGGRRPTNESPNCPLDLSSRSIPALDFVGSDVGDDAAKRRRGDMAKLEVDDLDGLRRHVADFCADGVAARRMAAITRCDTVRF